MGVIYQQNGPNDGLLVTVMPGSAAFAAGMRSGDEIISVDNQVSNRFEQLREAVQKRRSGVALPVTVIRNDNHMNLDILLGSQPLAATAITQSAVIAQPLDLIEEVGRQVLLSTLSGPLQ